MMLWLLLGLSTTARAQQDVPAQPLEIVVYGAPRLQEARLAVVRRLEALGYRVRQREADTIAFRPPERWMGALTLYGSGELTFGRRVLAVRSLSAVEGSEVETTPAFERLPVGAAAGAAQPAAVGAWLLPGQRVQQAETARVLSATEDVRVSYRAALQREGYLAWLDALPRRLDALWDEGQPVAGGAPLAREQRAAALLRLVATRPSDAEGDEAVEAVELWMERRPEARAEISEEAWQAALGARPSAEGIP
jgi:hypothetical protein